MLRIYNFDLSIDMWFALYW